MEATRTQAEFCGIIDTSMSPRKPKTDQKRLPKKKRVKKPPHFKITERDILFIKAVMKYRFLLVDQFAWLFPDASKRGMENRLRLLYHNRYLDRILLTEVHSNKLIYAMTEKGARLLAESEGVTREEIPWRRHLNKISMSHIKHLLAVNNVLISLDSALNEAQEKRQVEVFRVLPSDPELHKLTVTLKDNQGARYESSVIPDAVIGVKFRSGEFGLFFVEVDRATMTVSRWQDKVVVYHEYARSSELRKRFKTSWFIVLTVTTSGKRILSLAECTVAVGGKRGFWYTTADRVRPDSILKSVWTRASDLFSIRNEHVYPVAEYKKSDKVSIFDSIRGKHAS